MNRPPLHTDLILTMADGTVTDGRYTTVTDLHGINDAGDYQEQLRWYQRTEEGWNVCKAPHAWRLRADVEAQPEGL